MMLPGQTVYVTVMGFAGSGTNAPHVYRSVDTGGSHWTNISSNLPNAPANSVDGGSERCEHFVRGDGYRSIRNDDSYELARVETAGVCLGSGLPNAPVTQLAAAAAMPTGDGRANGQSCVQGTYGSGESGRIPLLTATSPAVPAIDIESQLLLHIQRSRSGTTSTSVTITVTNTGNAPLIVSSVMATGDFNETDTCVPERWLRLAGSCAVQVRFAPTVAGHANRAC